MATPVMQQWERLSALPFGKSMFSRALGFVVPYASTLGFTVEVLEQGRAVVRQRDRRAVRNHLGSIHASALGGLGELTANLALSSLQPKGGRWIVTGMEVEYVKKARGTITATCALGPVDWSAPQDIDGPVTLTDADGEVVVRLVQRWRIGPRT